MKKRKRIKILLIIFCGILGILIIILRNYLNTYYPKQFNYIEPILQLLTALSCLPGMNSPAFSKAYIKDLALVVIASYIFYLLMAPAALYGFLYSRILKEDLRNG